MSEKVNSRAAFIICWFGCLPDYFPIWMKSCEYNEKFDFLIFTDAQKWQDGPENVKYYPLSKKLLLKRIQKKIESRARLKYAYRVCDYRPMFGELFEKELKNYEFWGYCDLDLVFGQILNFVTDKMLDQYETIFNGGHFTLMKNIPKINSLYKKEGAIFNYHTVSRHEAAFAFDETTGIQRIARRHNIKAWFGIPYIDADAKYTQLRSRMDQRNPDYQAYYWEKGHLIRVKYEEGSTFWQEIAYIHLQKRRIQILSDKEKISDAFWICPDGYIKKEELGLPDNREIMKRNPYQGEKVLVLQCKKYKRDKLLSIIKRNPFQIYVRLKQQVYGINSGDGKKEEIQWLKY